MRIKSLEQLHQFCDSIYIANSKVRIVKFEDEGQTKIEMTIGRLTTLEHCEYLFRVLESAFKKRNVLDLSIGSSYDIFTIMLHMNLAL